MSNNLNIWLQNISKTSLQFLNGLLIATIILNGPLASVAHAAPKNSIDMFSFRLQNNAAATITGNQQQGVGSLVNGSISDYPDTACIPVEIRIKNNQNTVQNISVGPAYDFSSSPTTQGITDLQVISTSLVGDPKLTANNLSNFSYTTNPLSSLTSVNTSTGTKTVVVAGPFVNDTGTNPITATDTTRHYNVTVQALNPDEEAYVIFCARLSTTAHLNNGASISIRAGGGSNENQGFNKISNNSLTVNKVVVNNNGGTSQVADFPLFINGVQVTSGVPTFVSPGNFTVSETNNPALYAATFSGDCAADGTVSISNAAKTCTLTNDDITQPAQPGSLIVSATVINNNSGTATLPNFTFSIDGSAIPAFDQNLTDSDTFPATSGIHAVSVSSFAGYTATFSGSCDASGNITVPAAGSATCQVTLDDPAPIGLQPTTVTFIKNIINDDGGTSTLADAQEFLDNVQLPIDAAVNNATTLVDTVAGAHTVTTITPVGYTVSFSGACVDNNNGADITAINQTNVTCNITFDDLAATPTSGFIHIEHDVINDDSGTATTGNFPLFLNGSALQNQTPNNSSSFYGFDLAPGNYSLAETLIPGYSQSFSGDCANNGAMTLAAGQELFCTIVNDDIGQIPNTGSLTITKTVINNDGGSAVAADFPIRVEDGSGNLLAGPFPGSAVGSTISIPLDTPYVVLETQQSGYGLSGQTAGCQGTLTALNSSGDCTLTNDDVVPNLTTTLTVTKNVINDNGGNQTTSNFQLFIDGTPIANSSPASLSVSHVLDVAPGTHTISESSSFGYTGSFSGDCDANGTVFVPQGGSLTCILTNNDLAPGQPGTGQLTITENIINDDGGVATSANFQQFLDGTPFTSPDPIGLTVNTLFTVNAGLRQIGADLGNFTNYTITLGGDCDASGNITITDGSDNHCTITINDIPPVLRFTKNVINDNGNSGNLGVQNFQLFIDGTPIQDPNAQPGSTITHVLHPGSGTHILSESQTFGYFGTFSGDCDANGIVSLTSGDDKTCVLTNDDFAPGQSGTGQLIINQNIINDDGGTATSANFQQFLDGLPFTSPDPVGLSVSTTFTVSTGVHQVADHLGNFPDYTITFSDACDAVGNVLISNGSTAICTITIDDIAPKVTVIKRVINDNGTGGNMTTANFQLFFNGTPFAPGTVSANGLEATTVFHPGLGNHIISESQRFGYFGTFSGDCDANGVVSITSNSDNKTCILTNDDLAPGQTGSGQLVIHQNIINDNGGIATSANFQQFLDGFPFASPDPVGLSVSTTFTVSAGTHQVADHLGNFPDYTITFSGDCDASGNVNVPDTGSANCVITIDDLGNGGNGGNDPTGILVINKYFYNDPGNSLVASDFQMLVDGNPVPSSDLVGTTPDDGSHITTATYRVIVTPGQHLVSEIQLPGFTGAMDPAFEDCDDAGNVNVPAGSAKTCTIDNFIVSGTVSVIKRVINDNGGSKLATDFDIFFDNTQLPKDGIVPGLEAVYPAFEMNTNQVVTISETADPNYVGTFSGDCDASGHIIPQADVNQTCIITNNDIARRGGDGGGDEPPTTAALVVSVNVINHGGNLQPADLPVTVTGNTVNPANFSGSNLGTALVLGAGNYSTAVSSVPVNYSTAASADCSGTIALGESRNCFITIEEITTVTGAGGGSGNDTSGSNNPPPAGGSGNGGGQVLGTTDDPGAGGGNSDPGTNSGSNGGQVLGTTDDADPAELPRTGTGLPLIILALAIGLAATRTRKIA